VATAVAEEYLETIYNMAMEGEPVIGARLAEKFCVSRATVSETIKRLVADGYVVQHADRSITLTPTGRELTEKVLRRHRLSERLLFDLLGMDWISAHEEAHTLEHGMSDALEQQISERLGHPRTCPHGNPIPGNASSGEAFLREQNAFRLSAAQQGQTVRVVLISEVVEDETEVLRRLSDIGIHPGSLLTIVETDPTSAVVFEVTGQIRSVPRDLAAKIWVAARDERSVEESRVHGTTSSITPRSGP
jgi:DtxR family transcriptional regulator, Mn-dependent transcriptional regulator